jgi:protein required for attachment to host cells
MMKTTWILVANNANARIFTAETPSSPLTELEGFNHSESRLHDSELTTDLPGKIKNAGGTSAGHAFEQPTDPKKHEARVFAQELADYLETAHNEDKFRQLLLIADPSFLGLLRDELPDAVKLKVAFELDKNLVKSDAAEIREHLPTYLTFG